MSASTAKNSEAKRTPKTTQNTQQRGLLVIGAVVIVAVVAFIAIIALGNSSGSAIDYASIPQSRATDGAFILGNPDAPITIIEFADFACPHCQAYHPTMQQFIREFVATGKAKFEYRMLSYTGGAASRYSAQLLECANEQREGAFWEGYSLMYQYATTARYNLDMARPMAQELDVSLSQLLECSSSADQETIDMNFATNMNITGTPATMVRYGDSQAQFIVFEGVTYDRGGANYGALAGVVNLANIANQ